MGKRVAVVILACAIICGFTIQPALATYKVGAIFSVTGGASFLGDPEKKTAAMVVEQINRAGGINGEKIELIVYDDEGDATKCNLFAKKLINQDKVIAVIGPSVSGLSLAVLPVFEKEKTPLISCAASYKIVSDEKTGKPYPWIFKTPQSDSLAVEAIYTQMQKMGIKKIAILSVTDGFGSSGRQELIRLAAQYQMEIVADEKYDPKDTDMTTQLTKIKGLAPQAIINWSVGPTQVTVVRNWRDLGMQKITFFQSHGFGSRKNIELAGGAAEGVLCPLGACNIAELLPAGHPQKQVTMDYLRSYTAKYNEPLSSFGGHAWDAMHLVVEALKAVGPDKVKIRSFLENKKNFVGQHGVFNFSPDDHNGLTKEAFQMVVVKNGDWTLAE
ncbi:MAG: ABC transporter substrate-binding protein [Desulfobacteraceae bacterium]|nr:MAG: ABC transporter substrate-binding protein [Desulfobacteraceae bacterium]